jgi:ubiquinone/menaquinone biosynthesis C-methylase UbiE
MNVRTYDRSVGEHYARGDLLARTLRAAARLAGIQAGMLVLDVGGGLGEPARTLASEFGCAVEVLDLTEVSTPQELRSQLVLA